MRGTGQSHLSDHAAALDIGAGYLEREKQTQLDELQRRRRLYTPVRPPFDPTGRIVIIVDDGIATGASMLTAIHCTRARKPAKLVVATAVAPPETLHQIKKEADEVICLECPAMFYAVGQFFEEFPQVSDEEVMASLTPRHESTPIPAL